MRLVGTMTRDGKRHGTTTLTAASSVLDGAAPGRRVRHRRHAARLKPNRIVATVARARPASTKEGHDEPPGGGS